MYYVRIGVQSKHVYGKTSKGYRIYRIERTVFKEWGPVESVRPGGFRWKSPHGGPERKEKKTYRTVAGAKAYVEKMRRIRDRYHGYEELVKGDRIRRGTRRK